MSMRCARTRAVALVNQVGCAYLSHGRRYENAPVSAGASSMLERATGFEPATFSLGS